MRPISTLRVAIWQGLSPAGDRARALDTVARTLHAAAAAGAEVAVFPELFLPGYNSNRVAELAEPVDGAFVQAIAAQARATGCAVVTGFAERDGDRLYNSAVAIGADGERLAHFRKLQLYGAREAALFEPGQSYATFALAGRTCALLICYDIEFAPHVRALAAAGVDLILVPTANMAPFRHVPDLTVPAQAINHGLAIAYANYCGTEGDLDYVGLSCLVGADGSVAAKAGAGETLLVADVPVPAAALLSTQLTDYRPVGTAPGGTG